MSTPLLSSPDHSWLEEDAVSPLYFRGDVVVTWRTFCAHGRRYEIAALRGITRTRRALGAAVTALLTVATAEAVVAIGAVSLFGATRSVLMMAAPAVLAPCAIAVVFTAVRPPRHELRATYRGAPVVLFASRDEREFGRVSRAVQRAVEAVPRPLPRQRRP
jgi:hypothetical protein